MNTDAEKVLNLADQLQQEWFEYVEFMQKGGAKDFNYDTLFQTWVFTKLAEQSYFQQEIVKRIREVVELMGDSFNIKNHKKL